MTARRRYRRKPFGLLLWGFGCAWRRGLPVGNSSAGSALHPQGTSSLDPYRRKTSGLLLRGFGFRLVAGIALRQ